MLGEGALIADPEAAKAYLLAGKATVTLVSEKTGARYTYRVSTARGSDGRRYYVGLLTGASNESDYRFFGTIFADTACFRRSEKSELSADLPSVRAFAWAFEKLIAGKMPANCQVWHSGACGKCGRKLTVPESIASGLGPKCAARG